MTTPRKPPPFQFGLRSLFWLTAIAAVIVWLPEDLLWWVIPRAVMIWPLWLFFGWAYWLRCQSIR
jgi:hypothetical protein